MAVVATFADGSEQVGSGYLISSTLVLTAEHCTRDVVSREAPTALRVIRASDGADAAVVCPPESASELDVAVLEIAKPSWGEGLLLPTFGRVDRDHSGMLTDCAAIGFPLYQRDPVKKQRFTAELHGTIYQTDLAESGQLLMRDPRLGAGWSDASDAEANRRWGGLSGAVIFFGDLALGVIVEHHPSEGESALHATTIDTIAKRAATDSSAQRVANLLGIRSPMDLRLARGTPSATADAAHHGPLMVDVPARPTLPLVGRDDLVEEAARLLDLGSDVVLLGGLPGVGKSALAGELARNSLNRSAVRSGVLWVALGPGAAEAKAVGKLTRWAVALGTSEADLANLTTSGDLAVHVAQLLADARALLVIDDVWDEEWGLTFRLGGANCAHLMTTRSRDVAQSFEERGAVILEVDELDDDAAIELLGHVAPRVVERYPEEARACVRAVQGLPLAIWIVGHHLNVQPEPLLLDALHGLTGAETRLRTELKLGPTERPEWLRSGLSVSLYAALEQSTESLGPARAELARLSVFPPKGNSFSWPAASAVAQSSDDVVALWRHGLIEDSGNERLTIHQAVFDYARLLLTDDAAYRRLAKYFTELANESRYHSTKRDWLEELEQEHDNFRAALDWTIHAADAEAGVALAGALWPFWYERSYFTEGRYYIDQLLQLPGSDAPDLTIGRAKIINDSANLAYNQGDIVTAERLHREALELRTAAQDPAISGTWNNLGILARCRREYAQADALFREAAAANEQIWNAEPDTDLGKERRLWHGNNLDNLGVSLTEQGRLQEARTALEESVTRFAEVGSGWGIAMANSDLGQVCLLENDGDGAFRLWVESLGTQHRNQNSRDAAATLRRLGSEQPEAVPSSLAVAALRAALRISSDIGDNAGIAGALERLGPTLPPRDAAAAFGCAAAYRKTSGYLGPPRDADAVDQFTHDLREKLQAEFEPARAAGANERPLAFAAKLAEELQVSLDEVVAAFEAVRVERSAL